MTDRERTTWLADGVSFTRAVHVRRPQRRRFPVRTTRVPRAELPERAVEPDRIDEMAALERMAARLAGAPIDDGAAFARSYRQFSRDEVLTVAARDLAEGVELAVVIERVAGAHVPLHALAAHLLAHSLMTKAELAAALRALGRDARVLDD